MTCFIITFFTTNMACDVNPKRSMRACRQLERGRRLGPTAVVLCSRSRESLFTGGGGDLRAEARALAGEAPAAVFAVLGRQPHAIVLFERYSQ